MYRILYADLKPVDPQLHIPPYIFSQSDALQNLRFPKYIPSICSSAKHAIIMPVWMNK
jgi:hypothetical protein